MKLTSKNLVKKTDSLPFNEFISFLRKEMGVKASAKAEITQPYEGCLYISFPGLDESVKIKVSRKGQTKDRKDLTVFQNTDDDYIAF